MWQKAIVKCAKNERNKFMVGRQVWVEGPPCGNIAPSGFYIQRAFDHSDPTSLSKSCNVVEDYKTNIVQDGATLQLHSTRLGLLPYMLELLPEFCEEPEFVYFSVWSSDNA